MLSIGIDIGGTNVKIGVVNENYKIIYKNSVKTLADREPQVIIKNITDLISDTLQKNNLKKADIDHIGIGCPGNVDSNTGMVTEVANINISDWNLKKEIQEASGIETYIANDGSCAALGEACTGSTADVSHSVMLTLGTGIGGGIIIDKKLYVGKTGKAGEFGQMTIKWDDPPARYGRIGSFESYASGTALINQTREAIKQNPGSILAKTADNDMARVNGQTAFQAMQMNCPIGKKVVDTYIFYLSIGIKNIIMALRPEVITLGGGISRQGEILIKLLSRHMTESYDDTQIRLAELSNDAGIIGAVALKSKLE